VTDPVTGRTTSSLQAVNDLFCKRPCRDRACTWLPVIRAPMTPPSFFTAALLAAAEGFGGPIRGRSGCPTMGHQHGRHHLAGPQTFAITNQEEPDHQHSDGADLGLGLLDPVVPRARIRSAELRHLPRRGWRRRPVPTCRCRFINSTYREFAGRRPARHSSTTRNALCIVVTLRAGFNGRNVPDISLNSDPDTGYQVYYTDDQMVFRHSDRLGRRRALPPLNSTASRRCLIQAVGHRVGLLTSRCRFGSRRHRLPRARSAASGHRRPGTIGTITRMPDMNQATGLGVPDVANLLKALR